MVIRPISSFKTIHVDERYIEMYYFDKRVEFHWDIAVNNEITRITSL